MGRASGGSNTPHWIRNNILDFLRAMSVKIDCQTLGCMEVFDQSLVPVFLDE